MPSTPTQRRKHLYGLSEADWKGLLLPHNGMCWICREVEATDVDHDHRCCPTAKTCGSCFRGALCTKCNIRLGYLENGSYAKDRSTVTDWAEDYRFEIEAYLGA